MKESKVTKVGCLLVACFFLLVMITSNLQAQNQTISGTVIDGQTESTLAGVNILVKGTSTGASTNGDGQFSLDVASLQDTLVVSFIGYQTQNVPIDGRTKLEISLQSQAITGEEVVVIGYGTAKEEDVTGSISTVSSDDIEDHEMSNALEMLQGTVAGFSSIPSTGPGGGGSMKVRGTTSILASSDPLIVLDGTIFRGSIDDINPNDIKTINVLKGASAAAVYGSRAAAGVIEVTTKTGISSEPTINIKSSIGGAETGIDQKPLGPDGYTALRQGYKRQTYTNKPDNYYTDPGELPSGINVKEWKNMDPAAQGSAEKIWLNRIGLKSNELSNYLDGKSINWYDQALQRGVRQNHNISVSGKTDELSYYSSLQYINNEGMRVDNGYETYRARVNLDYEIADFLTVGTNTQFTNTNDGFLNPSVFDVMHASPLGDKYTEEGSLKWYTNGDSASENPFLYKMEDYFNKNRSLRSNLYARINLPVGFSFETRWVNRFAFNQEYRFTPSTHPDAASAGGMATREELTTQEWSIDNLLKWEKTFAEAHQFNVTFLYNVEKNKGWNTNNSNENFRPNEKLGYNSIASGLSPTAGSDDYVNTGEALMGRVNYSLLDRYNLSLSLRRDGYSAFGQQHPYAYFPAASASWRVSEENFFNIDWVNNLKLRVSYGVNGNRSIGAYSALARLGTTKYIYGNSSYTGVYASTMANPNLKWERTSAYNAGIDFEILDERLSGSVDAYYQSTSDMLLDRSLPDIVGYTSITSNIGKVDNRGFEMQLQSLNLNINNTFEWRSTFNFSLNRNEIKQLYGNKVPIKDENGNITGYKEASDYENGWYIGHSLNAIRNYKLTDVYKTSEAEQAAIYGRKPGNFEVRDVNQDSVLSPREDYVFQGKTVPQYRINFINNFALWSNFNLSFHLKALLDYKGINNQHLNSSYRTPRASKYDYPYWTRENQRSQWAGLTLSEAASGGTVYNYYEDRSFVQLQNFSVSYDIPDRLVQKSPFDNFKIYFNLENGPILTNWTYWNPQTMSPTPRIYTLGVNVTL